jgi:hypothetical protein
MPDDITTDDVLRAYVDCALWSCSVEEDYASREGMAPDVSLQSAGFTADDIDPSALASMREDVRDFLTADDSEFGVRFADALAFWVRVLGAEQVGHDFWLTRNRHGAGFWDRFYGDIPGEAHGRVLTEAAHIYGESDLYIGDDGRIYVS